MESFECKIRNSNSKHLIQLRLFDFTDADQTLSVSESFFFIFFIYDDKTHYNKKKKHYKDKQEAEEAGKLTTIKKNLTRESEVISIRILRMRLISAIMNFYWSHTIPLQKLSNERSYKFS